MAEIKKINTELQPIDKLLDTSGDAGTSGQILSTTGSGTNWIDNTGIGGGTVTGTGTTSRLTKFTDGPNGIIGNSGIQDASDAVAITINGNEEVGIGTTTPFVILHTKTSANNVGRFESTDATAYIQINDTADSFYIATGTQYGSIGGNASVHADNLNISLTTGNVGIGTATPSSKLQIGSRGTASALTINAASGDGILFDFYNDGNPYLRHASKIGRAHV